MPVLTGVDIWAHTQLPAMSGHFQDRSMCVTGDKDIRGPADLSAASLKSRPWFDWRLLCNTNNNHPSASVTHAQRGRSVVRAARSRPYIIAPSCLKTIWKLLLGCDPPGGWGLWLLGEHHVSQSQLYKLAGRTPPDPDILHRAALACGSLARSWMWEFERCGGASV